MRIQSEVASESASGTPMVRAAASSCAAQASVLSSRPWLEMQKAADGHQEIERGIETRAQPWGQELGFVRPGGLFFHGGDESEPVGKIVIAQAARTVFDVGLEVEDGVAEFVVAGTSEIGEPLHDRPRFARDELRNRLVVQASEKFAIAREIAAIEQRNCEFDIVRIEFLALGQGARRGAQLEPQIPHFLRKFPNAILELPASAVIGMEKKDVDI